MMHLMSVGCHGGSIPSLTTGEAREGVVCVRFHKGKIVLPRVREDDSSRTRHFTP